MPKKSKLTGKTWAGIILTGIVAAAVLVTVLLTTPWENTEPDSSADRSAEEIRPDTSGSSSAALPSPPVVGPLPNGSENFVATDPVADEGAEYRNNNVFIYQYNEAGDTISFGLDTDEKSDRLYINPSASIAEQGVRVGYQIMTSRVPILYQEGEWAKKEDPSNEGCYNFLIKEDDTTKMMVRPATYKDGKNFGIAWANDILYDGFQNEGTTLYIRVYNLDEIRHLIALCRVNIEYDQARGCYYIESVTGGDVLNTGEVTEEERTELVNRSIDLLLNNEYAPWSKFGYEYEDLAELGPTSTFVEYLGEKTYYNDITAPDKSLIKSNLLIMAYDNFVAVTMRPFTGTDFTLYYATFAAGINLHKDDPDNVTGLDMSPVGSLHLVYAGCDIPQI